MARLAILIPDMRGGGAERVALTLIEGFLGRRHEVDLVLFRSKGEFLGLVPAGVRVIDLDADRIRRAIRPLANYLRREKPASLLSLMWPLPVIAILASWIAKSNCRVVTSDHGILSEQYHGQPLRLLLLRLTTRFIYPLASGRVAASKGIANDLAKLSGLPTSAIETIPNPIQMPPQSIAVSNEVEALWGGKSARILTVGSLKPEKDHALLLEAFARLAKNRDAGLVIVGEGELREKIEHRAMELGIADRVQLPGFHADCWPFYASADIFVLSSKSEGFGNVLVEAMAAGLPVVSTDCSGPREVLDDGRIGRLVPTGDTEALCRAMLEALDEPSDRDALKARAKEFRSEVAVERYLNLLTNQAGGR